MDSLPTEVLHLICKHLSKEQAAKLRLVNRKISHVASYYLVDTVHFHTSEDSFTRLQRLSDHPVFHQTITAVIYEACTIARIGCSHAYCDLVDDVVQHAIDRPESPSHDASDREKRLYERNLQKHHQAINKEWRQYQAKFLAQQELLTVPMLDTHIAKAMSKFSNVNVITFSPSKKCQYHISSRLAEEFGPSCSIPMTIYPTTALMQLTPLLLPNGHVNMKLRRLEIDCFNPKFFSDESTKDLLVAAFTELTSIDLTLQIWPGDIQHDEFDDGTAFCASLRNGVLRDSLSAAQSLEELSIGLLDIHPYHGSVQSIFGETIWSNLTHLNLGSLSMTQEDLLELLERQPKLHTLGLYSMVLLRGCWTEAIEEMRNNLHLSNIAAWGSLSDQSDLYPVDYLDVDAYLRGVRLSVSGAIQLYVCENHHDNPLIGFWGTFYIPKFLEEECGSLVSGIIDEFTSSDGEDDGGIDDTDDENTAREFNDKHEVFIKSPLLASIVQDTENDQDEEVDG